MTVGLLSPCGWGNLGDAAIQDSAIHGIRRNIPDARIQAFTLNPDDTEQRHGIPADTIVGYSIPGTYGVQPRRGLADARGVASPAPEAPDLKDRLRSHPRLFAVLKSVRKALAPLERRFGPLLSESAHLRRSSARIAPFDLLLASGGGQLDAHWGGAWGHPYALYRWSVLAGLHHVPFGILSTGTGEVQGSLERWFFRGALERARYRSFRDEGSRTLALAFGADPHDPVIPDLAFGVPVRPRAPARAGDRPVLGVSPIVFERPGQWPVSDAARYEDYTGRLAHTVRRLVAEGYAYRWVVSDLGDRHAVQEVRARLDTETAAHEVQPAASIAGVADLLDALAGIDVLIASRLHAILLGFVVGTPAVALSYDRKVDTLMSDFALDDNRLDIRTFTPDDVLGVVRRLCAGRVAVAAGITRRAAAYRAAVDRQYDDVLGALLLRKAA
ncbi:MAG TPA: polysaccharide pyruvyl transferase family protein [Gemmatimonadales bacterium]|nr:polysaccharide pyruvyl transferase family protein [Gemmatimonadales bacterium]